MKKIIDYIKDSFLYPPRIGVVLGSGLDAFSNELKSRVHIKYKRIRRLQTDFKCRSQICCAFMLTDRFWVHYHGFSTS